jgi:uncharacterized membrane protein HdeD (DUF308 family)
MRIDWQANGGDGLWLAPAALGMLLVLIGVMLLVWPALLSYVVACLFIGLGLSAAGAAWRMRRRVSYHRIDPSDPSGPSL